MTNCDKEVSLLYPQCCSDKFKTSTMLYCSGLPCLNKTSIYLNMMCLVLYLCHII